MQKLVLFVLLALCVNANAFFVGGNIWDSRIQSDNVIREPAGALGFSLETGVFDEPENFIDYKMSIELRRFGYSFDDGEQTVAFWGIGIKPMIWSVTYKKFKEQVEYEQLTKDMEILEMEKAELSSKMQEMLDYQELERIGKRMNEINDLLDEKELRWLELDEIGG